MNSENSGKAVRLHHKKKSLKQLRGSVKMPVKIKAINIHAFRGVPDLELELNGKSLLLRGENGTGKSSIVEAIEFFFTGKISHLEGTKGLSLQRHGPHVKFNPEDVDIKITFNPGNVSLDRTFTSLPSIPEQFKDYFQITQKGTFILRRSQILTFIMSKPADRFRVIGSILGVGPLDDSELKMMRVCDDLKGEINSKKREVERIINNLSMTIGKKIINVEDVLPALNKMLQEANLPLIESLEKVDKHAEEMLKTVKKAESIDRIRILNEILEETKNVVVDKEVISELSSFSDKVKYLLREDNRLELSVADILERGQKVIEERGVDICPLCRQPIEREKVLVEIRNRLKTLQSLSGKASEVRTMSVPIINDLKKTVGKLESMISKIEKFSELSEKKTKMGEKVNFLNDYVDKVTSAKDLKNEIPTHEFNQQKDEINKIWYSTSKKCTKLLDEVGLTEKEKKVLSVVSLIGQVKSKAKDLSTAHSELKTYQDYYGFAQKIYSTFSETKKAKIQEIHDSMQENIQSFYSMLHPKDPHKNIELKVMLKKRASTKLEIESFGREGEDPRALASEGHLDSLGLCIFLAFVKKFNKGCPLIILDDVVSTIDAQHRKNICKLLFEEFNDNQLIITTHDEVWYEQLRAFQHTYRMEGNFKNLTIVGWNVDTGPIIRPYKPRWERIQEKIAQGDKLGAGNEGRQYLEWILEKICNVTNAPVPVNNWEGRMVSDLLPHVKKRIGDLIKDDEPLKTTILDKFKNLESTTIMGNILSHNNILAGKVSIEEVRGFCDSVHELHGVFLCLECGHFINYYRDLKILRCSNPKCKDPIEVKTK